MSTLLKNLLIACSAICTGIPLVHAADWQRTELGFRSGTQFTEPAIDQNVRKNTISLTHVRGNTNGMDFLNIDHLQSDERDPAHDSSQGAREVYVVYNHQWFLSPLTGKNWAFGPVKEVAISTGFDWNTKNTAFEPHVFKVLAGPTFKFNVAKGYLDLSLLYYQEDNHNGIVGKSVHFEPTYRTALAWGIPLTENAYPINFEGYLNYTGSKGKDGFGAYTEPETWGNTFLMMDMSTAFNARQGHVRMGVGYEYIRNKFGNAPGIGTLTTSPMIKIAIGF